MTGRLPQTQERLERGEDPLAAFGVEQPRELLSRRRADGVVDDALRVLELDLEDGFGARRELGEDVALHPAKHDRPDLRAETLRGAGIPCRDRGRVPIAEARQAAEEARVREAHDAPELFQAV